MRWKYYSTLLLIIIITIFSDVLIHYVVAKEKLNNQEMSYHKHEIQISVPKVANKNLENIIFKKIEKIKKDFLDSITDSEVQPTFTYSLNITYKKYETEQYLSYAFFIEEYLGGAHEIPSLWTIVYDVNLEKEVILQDFIYKDPNFLIKVAKSVRADLLLHPKIVNTVMMIDGTQPTKENYEHFVIIKNGLLFIFPPYQVAPYSSGWIESSFSI